ncbi:transcriptional regulator, partial [Neglecta sp. X4]|nr:transcriptional regulator [Neglectibacter sp. X4]
MKAKYIGERITELRLKMEVSEYQMSYDLGHNKNYIRA